MFIKNVYNVLILFIEKCEYVSMDQTDLARIFLLMYSTWPDVIKVFFHVQLSSA